MVYEIISDECFEGWPVFETRGTNRQTYYHYIRPKTIYCAEELENGRTRITTRGSIADYDAGLNVVIIRPTK